MKSSKSPLRLSLALACAAFTFSLAVCVQAQTLSYLANLSKLTGLGAGSVTLATDGNFYGAAGGGTGGGLHYAGDIFRVTPSGELNIIYNFCSQPNCPDGYVPVTPILGSDGNLYGVTEAGGGYYQGGTVYKMTLGGELTTLYTFCVTYPCNDGAEPLGIIQASDGNLYGTTFGGGESSLGTIFRVSTTGVFTVLHSFCSIKNCADGYNQFFPPIEGNDGNLYGTTTLGGANGSGAIYKLTPDGTYTIVHNFCSLPDCADGSEPDTIVQDANGNFFGTTQGGGSRHYGTVFELTSTNEETVLANFDRVLGTPIAGLTLANDGNYYGTTAEDLKDGGTIFRITPTGRIKFLYAFGDNCAAGGYYPWRGQLLQGTDGALVGTTLYGNGSGNCPGFGTVYSFSNGLSPLVKTAPVAGKVGTQVIILGNNLTGSSGVTFNGVAAAFTVESDTYIKATVPASATTGTVSVVTPSGRLNSNPRFVVTH